MVKLQSRRRLLAALAIAMLNLRFKARAKSAPKARPNFLILVADDMGYSDMGAFGGEIETPNLDALAFRGHTFTGLHSSPTCSPTRAMLLTGLDNHEAGLGNMAEALAPNQRGRDGYEGYLGSDTATLAELLGHAGYRTLFSGKWHLGLTLDQDPSRRGFQQSFALLQASHNHFGLGLSSDPAKGFTYRENGRTLESLPAQFYSSDYFAAKLVEQLKAPHGKAKGSPFFAYLAFSAPHWPLQAPAKTIARYKGRYDGGYEELRRTRLRRQVELGLLSLNVVPHEFHDVSPWDSLSPEQKAVASRKMEVYAAMVDHIDQNVGLVLQALRESGELDNTIILFLSDNGADGMMLENQTASPAAQARFRAADNRLENMGAASSYCSIGPGWAQALNAPSWDVKGAQTEGGTRVTGFIAGPAIEKGTSAAFLSVMDVVPTFLELANEAPPGTEFAGRRIKPVRGRSWMPLLSGRAKSVYPSDSPVGAELLGERAVREGDWKLLDRGDGKWLLFNIALDPGETRDLATEEPERTRHLVERWDEYQRTMGVVQSPRLPR